MRCAQLTGHFGIRHHFRSGPFDLFQNFRADMAGGDFTQRHDRHLVVFPVDRRLRAIGQLAGALGGDHDQLEQVGDVLQTVFDSDAGHENLSEGGRKAVGGSGPGKKYNVRAAPSVRRGLCESWEASHKSATIAPPAGPATPLVHRRQAQNFAEIYLKMKFRPTLLALGVGAIAAVASLTANAEGDGQKGKTLAYTCHGCHGVPNYKNAYPSYSVPRLGGQHAKYLAVALGEYASGDRPHQTMHAQATTMSEQDRADIAAYLHSEGVQSAGEVVGTPPPATTTCVACHGADGAK